VNEKKKEKKMKERQKEGGNKITLNYSSLEE